MALLPHVGNYCTIKNFGLGNSQALQFSRESWKVRDKDFFLGSFSEIDRRPTKMHVACANVSERKAKDKPGKKQHHLWMKRDSAGSGQKALNLVQIVSIISNEKEVVYGVLDKWISWETEVPLIAATKALGILRKRSQWLRIIQICKWMLSKGQVLSMGTYDILLLAFDMEGRVEEAEYIWNMVLQKFERSVSKRLFSRMISLYDHNRLPDKILEVFADMEELAVKPDDDTVRRVERAFQTLGLDDKQKQLMEKYERKWKHLRFRGEQVKVKTRPAWD